jgi:hypothetical protein
MGEAQAEWRVAKGVDLDLRHQIALAFSRAASEYLRAEKRDSSDPEDDIAGLRERSAADRLAPVEAHVKADPSQVRHDANPDSHRRVLAVLAYLRTAV